MTVAHDAAVESSTFTTTTPATWTHTPTGTPKGILVFISHGTVADELILNVTYGGVHMYKIGEAMDAATELGRVYCYFLGSGIPTGNQTVSVEHTATATVKIGTSISVTAAADTEVSINGTRLSANVGNPQITLDSGAVETLRYFSVYSGLGAPSDLTLVANMSAISDHDFGNFVSRVDRQTTAATGSVAVGYTGSSDDVAMIAFAICEVDSGYPILLGSRVTRFGTTATAHSSPAPSPIAAGDLIRIIFAYQGANGVTVTTPTDFTALPGNRVPADGPGWIGYVKVAAGTEGGTSIALTTSGNAKAVTIIEVFKAGTWWGSLATLADAIAVGTIATGTSSAPNPPSLNPANWDVEKTMWTAITVNFDNLDTVPTQIAGYAYAQQFYQSGVAGSDCGVNVYYKKIEAASEDPGTSTLEASLDWIAQTIAIRPAAAGGAEEVALAGAQPATTGAIALVKRIVSLAGSHPAATGAPTAAGLKYLVSLAGDQPAPTGTLFIKTFTALAGDQPSATGAVAAVYNIALAGNQPSPTGALPADGLKYLVALAGNQPAPTGALIIKTFLSLAGNQPSAAGALLVKYLVSLAGNQASATGAVDGVILIDGGTLEGNQPASTGELDSLLLASVGLAGNQPASTGAFALVKAFVNLAGNQPNAAGSLALIKYLTAHGGNQPAPSGALLVKYLIALAGAQPAATGTIAAALLGVGATLEGNQPASTGMLTAATIGFLLLQLMALDESVLLAHGFDGSPLIGAGLDESPLILKGFS